MKITHDISEKGYKQMVLIVFIYIFIRKYLPHLPNMVGVNNQGQGDLIIK